MSPKNKQFNVLLSPDIRTKLDEISRFLNSNNAVTLRQLINNAHLHIILQVPTCPSGQACFAPQMHPRRNLPSEDAAA